MKINFSEVGIVNKLLIFTNGQDAVDHFDKILANLENDMDERGDQETVQPVKLLLLDINMPIVSGMEALKQIKEKY